MRPGSGRNLRDHLPMREAGTAGRLLALLSLLQSRREWTGEELCGRLEVSPRTARRDVHRLRDLGYPIESTPGPAGGYRLRAGTAMPPLLLDDEEAVAVAIGLRAAARTAVTGIEETSLSALVKLEQVLPTHLRRRVQALTQATEIPVLGRGPTADPHVLTLLAGAVRDRERARLHYRGRDGKRSRRAVEPHALVALGRRWYLLAWDAGRASWRTFRVDRIERAAADGGRFQPRPIPDGDASAYVRGSIARAVYRYEALVTYRAPAEEIRARVGDAWGSVQELDAGSCTYRVSEDDVDWLAMRIGMVGVDFSVQGPPELLRALTRMGRRFSAAGGPSSRRR
jgi:predicted DNA-binding transcriptional regulator YafY